MAGKITYRKRNIVSTRQLYRRIAVDIKNTWNEIQQKQIKNQQTNYKKNVNMTLIIVIKLMLVILITKMQSQIFPLKISIL